MRALFKQFTIIATGHDIEILYLDKVIYVLIDIADALTETVLCVFTLVFPSRIERVRPDRSSSTI